MDRAQLKQRIVGAVVLAAVAVIVIPIVLNFGHEREWWGQRSAVPEPPQQGFVTRVLPLEQWSKQGESELAAGTAVLDKPPQPPATPPQRTAPAPAPSTGAAPPRNAAPVVVPAPSSSPSSKTSVPTVPAPTAPSRVSEAWVVQLGSFSSKKNAEALQAFLGKKGFRASVDHGMQGGDSVYRVRIGPEKERGRADSLRDRVERETQLRAIVLRYP